ncbi:MAG: aspartyl protease family protein [Bdellovibrionaceae bacterium]|nr:aspartyl protease family protein [Pseudobdellovibrionaceae bacterium]
MAIFTQIKFQVRHVPDPANPTQVQSHFTIGPQGLFAGGIVMDMVIAVDAVTAQTMQNGNQIIPSPISAKALVDTGCTVTSIDQSIAQQLGLVVRGMTTTHTAAGPTNSSQYFIAFSFPGTNLQGRTFHQVQSVNLTGQPFQVLIGRDLMASWSINYNGPSGYVSISD